MGFAGFIVSRYFLIQSKQSSALVEFQVFSRKFNFYFPRAILGSIHFSVSNKHQPLARCR